MARAESRTWSTRQLVTMALLCAIAILLSFVEFPIFPAAPYLKYDASFVAVLVGGFAYGPAAGAVIGIVEIAIHGVLMGDLWGSIMNIIAMLGFILPAAAIYKKHRTFKGAMVGLVCGCVGTILCAILGDLVIIPIYTGTQMSAVAALIIPVLLPFNALKAVLNAVLTGIVYKAVSNLITPKKDQVVGKPSHKEAAQAETAADGSDASVQDAQRR